MTKSGLTTLALIPSQVPIEPKGSNDEPSLPIPSKLGEEEPSANNRRLAAMNEALGISNQRNRGRERGEDDSFTAFNSNPTGFIPTKTIQLSAPIALATQAQAAKQNVELVKEGLKTVRQTSRQAVRETNEVLNSATQAEEEVAANLTKARQAAKLASGQAAKEAAQEVLKAKQLLDNARQTTQAATKAVTTTEASANAATQTAREGLDAASKTAYKTRLGNMPGLRQVGTAMNNFIQRAEEATKAIQVAKAAKTSGESITWGTRALSITGRTARFMTTGVGGRVLPVLGAGLAAFDVGKDLYKIGTMEKQEGESDEEFNKRLRTAKVDFAINATCTAAGAIIGACLGGPLGAMVGAGIGNLVGNLFKSGGLGRTVCRGIGRFFGF